MHQPATYRPCVVIIAYRDDEFLIISRYNDGPDEYKFPQGGIQEGDTDLISAARREFAEELGTDKLEIIGVSEHTNAYDWDQETIKRHYDKSGKWFCGQRQRFVVARFTGSDEDLDLCDQEVQACQWASRDDVLRYNQDSSHAHFSQYNSVIADVFAEFEL